MILRNVGAIIRSAAAFKAAALLPQIVTRLMKVGCWPKPPVAGLSTAWCRAGNLGDTLEELKRRGFFVVGLTAIPTMTSVECRP